MRNKICFKKYLVACAWSWLITTMLAVLYLKGAEQEITAVNIVTESWVAYLVGPIVIFLLYMYCRVIRSIRKPIIIAQSEQKRKTNES